jgi:hypothetical protein
MLERNRRRPSPAAVISIVALIVVVGGGSFAAASSHHPLTLKKVKRIATKLANRQITIRAAGLSVAHASSADNATTAANLTPPEAVHLVGAPGEPNFVGGAKDVGLEYTPLGFWRDRQCMLHLQGTILSESGSPVFRLPEADRPAERVLAPIAVASPEDGPGVVEIRPSGAVTPTGAEPKPKTYDFGFDGVSFRVANC